MTRTRPLLALLALAAAFAASAGPAHAALRYFQTPSHNIGCIYTSDGLGALRCDTRFHTRFDGHRPRSCDLDYGQAFGLNPRGGAHALCAGDTALNRRAPVLPYGRALRPKTDPRCVSMRGGLTCHNRRNHGFTLSRSGVFFF